MVRLHLPTLGYIGRLMAGRFPCEGGNVGSSPTRYFLIMPNQCVGRTAVFGTARKGSTPLLGTAKFGALVKRDHVCFASRN